MNIDYRVPGPVAAAFLADRSRVKGIMGPVGSGKSSVCCVDLMQVAMRQAADRKGRRRTKFGIIRSTYAELRTTTMQTWLKWFPEEEFGRVRMNPPPYHHAIRRGALECDVFFLALDRPTDVDKLLSSEWTALWLNEARQLSKSIVDEANSRIGRYPSLDEGGPTWHGMLMDTNSMDEAHWWAIMAGYAQPPPGLSELDRRMLVKPEGWTFFRQPPAALEVRDAMGEVSGYVVDPAAENVSNIVPGYYPEIMAGKGKRWIDIMVRNQLGTTVDGKPVYPTWNDRVHLAKAPLVPLPGVRLQVGFDFGLTPAAVVAQEAFGRWLVLAELVAENMGAQRFAVLFRRWMAERFPEFPAERWKLTGDPAGDHRSQADERTPYMMFRQQGLVVRPASTNDPTVRREAVEQVLGRMVDGQPGIVVDPGCVVLVGGFAGGYHYRRLQVSGDARHDEEPEKNRFSHVHDALQYDLLGGGEGRRVVAGGEPPRPVNARHEPRLLERRSLREQRSGRL